MISLTERPYLSIRLSHSHYSSREVHSALQSSHRSGRSTYSKGGGYYGTLHAPQKTLNAMDHISYLSRGKTDSQEMETFNDNIIYHDDFNAGGQQDTEQMVEFVHISEACPMLHSQTSSQLEYIAVDSARFATATLSSNAVNGFEPTRSRLDFTYVHCPKLSSMLQNALVQKDGSEVGSEAMSERPTRTQHDHMIFSVSAACSMNAAVVPTPDPIQLCGISCSHFHHPRTLSNNETVTDGTGLDTDGTDVADGTGLDTDGDGYRGGDTGSYSEDTLDSNHGVSSDALCGPSGVVHFRVQVSSHAKYTCTPVSTSSSISSDDTTDGDNDTDGDDRDNIPCLQVLQRDAKSISPNSVQAVNNFHFDALQASASGVGVRAAPAQVGSSPNHRFPRVGSGAATEEASSKPGISKTTTTTTTTAAAAAEAASSALLAVTIDKPNLPQSEIDALQAIYDAANGADWDYQQGILSEVPWNFSTTSNSTTGDPNPCTENWAGVHCHCSPASAICTVTRLELSLFKMVGPLSPSVGDLANLTSLALTSNNLTGTIPGSIGRLTMLQYLGLADNDFTGPIPDMLFTQGMKDLERLVLSRNSLSGSIPPA